MLKCVKVCVRERAWRQQDTYVYFLLKERVHVGHVCFFITAVYSELLKTRSVLPLDQAVLSVRWCFCSRRSVFVVFVVVVVTGKWWRVFVLLLLLNAAAVAVFVFCVCTCLSIYTHTLYNTGAMLLLLLLLVGFFLCVCASIHICAYVYTRYLYK